MSDISNFLTGFSNSLSQYLNLGNQMALQKQSMDYQRDQDMAAKKDFFNYQQQAEQASAAASQQAQLQRSKDLEVFKAQLEDLQKRGQNIPLGSLKDIPEFAAYAQLAPDALLSPKDLIDHINNKNKAVKEALPKEFQFKAGGYYKRGSQANKDLEQLVREGVDPTSLALHAQGKLPMVMQGANWKRYMQSRDNFINAYLRRDSGAAISVGEYETADRQFFPMPGDDKKTLAQKAANRQGVLDSIKSEAQGKEVDLSTPQTSNYDTSSSKLEVGHVEEGYRYKGGDPGKPSSWEKI